VILCVYLAPLEPDIQQRVVEFAEWWLTDLERQHFAPPLAHLTGAGCLACAEAEDGSGEILGLAGWQEGESQCSLFACIRWPWWGLGWGYELSAVAVALAPIGKRLLLTVHPDHLPAIRLYQRLGFREIDRILLMEHHGAPDCPGPDTQ
jgi:RimJ/RimL family protein N-acetyltransferase